jgi:hypothetical protein
MEDGDNQSDHEFKLQWGTLYLPLDIEQGIDREHLRVSEKYSHVLNKVCYGCPLFRCNRQAPIAG